MHSRTTGVHVSVIKGDITTQRVDTIVNAANSSLTLAVGVSGAISRAGGRAIQTECDKYIIKHGNLRITDCVWTTPGRLPCKCIIHAVGPNFVPGGELSCKQELYDTCQKALNTAASRLNAKSIAMPGISSGASGMPRRLCAEAMCSAIVDFVENGRGIGSSLSYIRIVDYDREAVKAFCDVFKAKVAKDSTSGATGQGFTSSGTGYTASGTGYTASGTGYTSSGTGYTTSGAAGHTTSVTTGYNMSVTTGYSTSGNMAPSSPDYGSTSHFAPRSVAYPGPTQTYVTASSPSYPHSTPSYPRSGDLTQTYPGASGTQPSQSHSTFGQTHRTTSRNISSFSSPRASCDVFKTKIAKDSTSAGVQD
ncbi:protein mono-ADP-ribosyltransferase PARP14-like [Branchiostoma floridae x Branchiostoma japonicum]